MKKINILIVTFLLLYVNSFLLAQLPDYVPSNGLIAYYPFNGNANDASGNNLHAQLGGDNTPVFVDSRENQPHAALSFTGINATLSSSGSHVLLPEMQQEFWQSFSISLWVKQTNIYTDCSGSGWGACGIASYINFGVTPTMNSVVIYRANGGISFVIADSALSYIDNYDFTYNWKHFVLTYDGLVMKAFIDGIEIGSKTITSPVNIYGSYNALARSWWAGAGNATETRFNGLIDDVALYNRALNPQEILQLANGTNQCNLESPIITASSNTIVGATGSVELTANFNAGLSYQWYRNNIAIQGATTANYSATLPGDYYLFAFNDTCFINSNTLEIDLFDCSIVPSNPVICAGDSLLLNVSIDDGYVEIDTRTEGFTSEWQNTYQVNPGSNYKLVITGTYGWGASPCPLTSRDAAYDFNNNSISPYNSIGLEGFYCTAYLPLSFGRPQPDIYQTNHNYTYYFTPDTNAISIGYFDSFYNDNCGQITYTLYEKQTPVDFIWSTGETTPSILVSPQQNTSYSITVVQDGFTCQNTVEVQVVEPSNDTLYVEIVEGSFYSFNNQILTSEGIYTANLNNAGGCDSIVTLVLSFGPFTCTVTSSDLLLCNGEESTLTVQTNALDTFVWGPNLLNGPFTGGTLSIIEFSAAQGASNYGGNGLGSNCNELWRPYGTFCDEGLAANSPFLSEKSNTNSGATWNRGSGGYGVLVLDLQDVKTFNALSAFQMFSDGKLTQLSMFYWPENNTAVPASSNTEWIPLFTNELIGPGAQSGNTVSDPTLFEFETIQSRYIMFHAYNSGIYGSNGYIEIRSLKLFNKSQTNADILWSTGETTPTINVSPTQTTTYSVTVNQGGQTCTSDVTVSVSQLPNVTFEPDLSAFCNNSGTVDLSGGSPAGGTYSGPGVVNNTFSPALAGGGLHTITYTVSNLQGCIDEASTTFEVAICTGSSITESDFASVLPNPFHNLLTIRMNTSSLVGPITLKLTDAAGRIVVLKTIQENQNDFNVDVSQLTHGIYTLTLSNAEQFFVKRLVK